VDSNEVADGQLPVRGRSLAALRTRCMSLSKSVDQLMLIR
jgi:hypothetical protein